MDGSYNEYKSKSSKKEIIDKSICQNKMLEKATPAFRVTIAGLIISILFAVVTVELSKYCLSCWGSLAFIPTVIVALAFASTTVMLIVNFIVSAIDIYRIKRGNFRISEETIDYKTIEYVHKWRGTGKRLRRVVVTEYVIYFKGVGRYVDSNSELSIFNTSEPDDKFYIISTNGKKPKYIMVFDQRHYEWEG